MKWFHEFSPPHFMIHCVIGSGPAGVACAKALLRRGAKVLMLDAGLELEPERARLVAEMGRRPPAGWSDEHLSLLKENTQVTGKGIPLKRVFGSDFPYRGAEEHLPTEYRGVASRPSLALGGFSNVWGAAMLPYLDQDMEGWPISGRALAEHYRAVVEFTGLAGRSDDLESLFPLHTSQAGPLNCGRQAQALVASMERNREALRKAGLHFGAARVAVRAARRADEPGCIYCGLCMYGCAYGHIYNSADTVRQMRAEPNFSYQPGVIVTALRESENSVRIEGYLRDTRAGFSQEAGRVYLAAGLLPSTRILLHSQAAYDETLVARDSQYFLFPLLLLRRPGDARSEALNTLSQLFLEIQNPRINRHTVHLQIYSYNDLVGQAVRQKFGPLARPLEFLARQLEDRMLIVQGYLHSDDSPALRMTLRKRADHPNDLMEVEAEANPATAKAIGRVLRLLLSQARKLKAVPLRPMLQVAEAGRGFHSGSSFPMRARPGRFESDVLGRPPGWRRVHAVDASVLPAIPATTITFSVMANAHRIGWEASALP